MKNDARTVMLIFGTRPEAIKLFPVVRTLADTPGIRVRTCVTAQHRGLLDQVLSIAGLTPDIDLDLMEPGQSLDRLTARLLTGIGETLDAERPDRVIVQGDTATAMAGALAAYYRRIPVSHVEAGLRSGDIYAPWPEEVNRLRLQLAPAQRSISGVTFPFSPFGGFDLGNLLTELLPNLLFGIRPAEDSAEAQQTQLEEDFLALVEEIVQTKVATPEAEAHLRETIQMLGEAGRAGALTVAVTNNPTSPMAEAASAPGDVGRSASTTLAPPATSASAVARPRPLAPPVTRATQFSMSIGR